MKVTQDDLARYTAKQLAAGTAPSTVARKLAQYLVRERRTRELGAIMRKVTTIREHQHGIIEADVVSAYPLSVSTAAHIKTILGGKGRKVILNQHLDGSVVGGVRVATLDKGIDTSVRAQLKQLTRLTEKA